MIKRENVFWKTEAAFGKDDECVNVFLIIPEKRLAICLYRSIMKISREHWNDGVLAIF